MRDSLLHRLHRSRNLGVRSREQPGDLFGYRLVGGKTRQLALPKLEITPRQAVEIRGLLALVVGHAATIAQPRRDGPFRRRKPCLVALRHRR
jgi:hypothetical protein